MRIIKIATNEDGAHAYQTLSVDIPLPDGYALVPDDVEIPDTIPYVNIEVENYVVTSMTAGKVPEPEPIPEPEPSISVEDTTLDMLADHEARLSEIELGITTDK